MHLRTLAIALLVATPAFAQQPAEKLIVFSLQMQNIGVELQKAANEMQTMQHRIAELEKLCGEACKKVKDADTTSPR